MAEYGFLKRRKGYNTESIHAGHNPMDWPGGDVHLPICTAVVYKQTDIATPKGGYGYSRFGNPTRNGLQARLASLEEAKHCLVFSSGMAATVTLNVCPPFRFGNPTRNGLQARLASLEEAKHCLVFSSGMAATVTLAHLLSQGDHILLGDELYGGSPKYFIDIASRLGIRTTYFDATDLAAIPQHIQDDTKLVWIESPSNPLLKIIDIQEVSRRVHQVRPDVIVVVDNTFLTSYFQKPLELGADISMASCTKYYNGHTDVTMGAVMLNDDKLYERLHYLQKAMGTIPSPIDCAYVARSLQTLPVRMDRHMSNGLAVAKFLENHPRVRKVIHPMLESHPQHELAKRQSYGHSGMLCCYLQGGESEARRFLTSLKVFTLGGSLGGTGSLIAMALRMIDLPNIETDDPEKYSASLMRVSVGLEEAEDLISDLEQALNKAFHPTED